MRLENEEAMALNADLQIKLPLMKEGARVYVASPLSAPTPAEIEQFERLRETINACKNMDAHEYPLRELRPELVYADDRPACWGGWNNATAKWDAECEVCEAWMLNQKPMTMEASPE